MVNQAINDNGTWRGKIRLYDYWKDFVKLAFQFAREDRPRCRILL